MQRKKKNSMQIQEDKEWNMPPPKNVDIRIDEQRFKLNILVMIWKHRKYKYNK